MTACIVGWAHSRFGKLEGETLESLIVKVANDAMEHAGIPQIFTFATIFGGNVQ